MLCKVAEVTVRLAEPPTAPKVALIAALPAPTAVARPEALTEATDRAPDDQVTRLVMSTVVPSEYVPCAVSCCVAPTAMLGAAGVTLMLCRVACLTVSVVLPVTWVSDAVICVAPAASVVARPDASTEATAGAPEDHVTRVLMSCEVPSV